MRAQDASETALIPADIELDASRLGVEPRHVRRILGICNGIGVSSVCLTRLGVDFHKTVAETDEDCRRLTKARFPEEIQYGDLRNLLEWPLEKFAEFDLLEGGFPCQDVSSANKQGRGLKGDKACLFFVCFGVGTGNKVSWRSFRVGVCGFCSEAS